MSKKFHLFSVIGIEIEYMIVDSSTRNILPIADKLLEKLANKMHVEMDNEIELGEISASNELALHVIELKTNGPKRDLKPLTQHFHQQIQSLNALLKSESACLMPTGAHPWYDPHVMMKLWPHGDQTIYNTFHRLFNCVGHGWSNLQSVHINLPFGNNEEFSKLHNAIRLLMPLIPALTASTPFIEGKVTGFKDTRLDFYGTNQKKIPVISGQVIPEFILSEEDYNNKILGPIYKAIAPLDTEGVLQHEWVNSRGAIARFDRSAIEIRIVDTQECASADIACVFAIVSALKYLVNETEDYLKKPINTERLKILFDQVIKEGLDTSLANWSDYINSFHLGNKEIQTARDFWTALLEKSISNESISSEYEPILEKLLSHGNLSERLLVASKKYPLNSIYTQLCECLHENQLFLPAYL